MGFVRASYLALLVVLSASDVIAFSVLKTASVSPTFAKSRTAPLRMAEDDAESQDGTFMKSALKKEIVYDEKSGRFFETGYGEGDCIPDEEYCFLDKDTGESIRLTVEEKERIFLDSLQAYYTSGRKLLSDGEFDLLKEDLQWSGSAMVTMSQKEVKYLTAMQDYMKGKPSMPDAEFDQLKVELKEDGSKFAVQTEPQCYLDTGVCKVTMQKDNFRSNLLYLPAGFVLMTLWLLFGYELIEPIIRINPIILGILGSPWVYTGAKGFTESVIFENKLIAYGPCPSCNFQNRIYFGNILGVEGFKDVADCKCPNCKTNFNVQRASLRASTVPKPV